MRTSITKLTSPHSSKNWEKELPVAKVEVMAAGKKYKSVDVGITWDGWEKLANVWEQMRMPDKIEEKEENTELETKAHLAGIEPVFVPIGVTSFADLDAMEEAKEVVNNMKDATTKFAEMSENIFLNPEIEDKAQALQNLATEFATRIQQPMDDKECDDCDNEEKIEVWQPVTDSLFNLIADLKQAECKTEGGVCYPASDYAFVPDKTKPSTWKLRMSQGRPGNITVSQLGRAAAAFSESGFRGQRVQIPSGDIARVKTKLRSEYRKLDAEIPDSIKEISSFDIWENKETGQLHWLATYSNNIIDKEQEIISSDSHRNFVDMVDKGMAPLPELWLWHRPEWKWGQSTSVAYDSNGFAIAAGTVDDNEPAKELAFWLKERDDILVSHGMPKHTVKRDNDNENVIIEHITREVSPLFSWRAANDITNFSILKENTVMQNKGIPEEKREELLANGVSPDTLTNLEQINQGLAKETDEAGLDKKEETTAEVVNQPDDDLKETVMFLAQQVAVLANEVKELKTARAEQKIKELPVATMLANVQGLFSEGNALKKETEPAGVKEAPVEDNTNGVFFSQWMGGK